MKRYYECHITIAHEPGVVTADEPNKMTLTRTLGVIKAIGWIGSHIEGDPDLGPGVKCYATKHFHARRTCEGVIRELNAGAKALGDLGCKVLRQKVEFVMYDERAKP